MIAGTQAASSNAEHGTRREPTALDRRKQNPLSAVAWRPHENMPFSDWLEQGRRLGLMGRSSGWWVGDWLNYGNAAYGERYVRASRITGYDVQTLMNMAYVSSRFHPSQRREPLSWSHHAQVAALTPEHQERLLVRAEAKRLSVRDLRDEVRRERRAAKEVGEYAVTAKEPERRGSDAVDLDAVDLVCPECGHTFPP